MDEVLFSEAVQAYHDLQDPSGYANNYLDLELNPLQKHIAHMHFKNISKSEMILAPIGFGKTTSILDRMLEAICNNRNIRILYAARTYSLAKSKVAWMSRQLRNNQRIQRDYGEFYDKENAWTGEAFTVIRETDKVDPTVHAVGLHQSIEGGRFDLGVLDDVIDIRSFSSETERENVWEWYNLTFRGRIDPHMDSEEKPIWIIGGRWHPLDLYSQVMEASNIPYSVYTCWKTPEEESWWPEQYTTGFLLKEKNANPLYAMKYLNNPEAVVGGRFRPDMIQYYNTAPQGLNVYQGWDLAISEKQTADYTVCMTIGIDHNKDIYILHIYRDRVSFPDQVRMVKLLNKTWHPLSVGIEDVAYQRALPQQVLREAVIPIDDLANHKVTGPKDVRLLSLVPYFANKKIWIKKDMQDLVVELLSYPGGRNDDQLDALWHALQCCVRGGAMGVVNVDLGEVLGL